MRRIDVGPAGLPRALILDARTSEAFTAAPLPEVGSRCESSARQSLCAEGSNCRSFATSNDEPGNTSLDASLCVRQLSQLYSSHFSRASLSSSVRLQGAQMPQTREQGGKALARAFRLTGRELLQAFRRQTP